MAAMTILEHLKADLAEAQNAKRKYARLVKTKHLAKLIAVYNAADDAVGSVYDQQYDRELRSALSALTKPDGE